MKDRVRKSAWFFLIGVVLTLAASGALAQVTVTSANPTSTVQGTVNLDVVVAGSGFQKGAKAQWFMTGTTNPGGVTVNSTAFVDSGHVKANITVAVDAATVSFDIQVTNSNGRSGKGTELFAVNKKTGQTGCVPPAPVNPPLNPPVLSIACSTATGQTCLDATFGNPALLPPGGLVLTDPSGLGGDRGYAVKRQLDGKLVAYGESDKHITTIVHNKVTVNTIFGAAFVRYNSDGSLDTSFGSGGAFQFFDPANNNQGAFLDGAIDANGNLLGLAVGILVRSTPSGALDPSFNSVGYVRLQGFGGRTMRLQADGKILVGGGIATCCGNGAIIERLNPDGTMDATFGSNGRVTLSTFDDIEGFDFQASSLGQYIYVGGSQYSGVSGGPKDLYAVMRLNPDGSPDPTFGVYGGVATTSFCGTEARIFSISVDPLGNVLAAGRNTLQSGDVVMTIARYSHSGALDSTFGDSSTVSSGQTGFTTLDFFGQSNHPLKMQSVFDSSGNETGFLVAGYASGPTGTYMAIAKYHAGGSLDTTFGTSGATVIDFGDHSATGWDLLVQPDGKVVIGGEASRISGPYAGDNFALARLWQ